MSRIATIKETGIELSAGEWKRFDEAVAASLKARSEPWPFARGAQLVLTPRLPAFHHTAAAGEPGQCSGETRRRTV